MKKLSLVFLCSTLALGAAISASAATVPCTVLTRALSVGSTDAGTGGEVSKLQAFLAAGGLLASAPTGYFGPMTQKAVAAFQSAAKLEAVGSVGPRTRAAVQLVSCGTSAEAVSTATAGAGSGDSVSFKFPKVASSTSSSSGASSSVSFSFPQAAASKTSTKTTTSSSVSFKFPTSVASSSSSSASSSVSFSFPTVTASSSGSSAASSTVPRIDSFSPSSGAPGATVTIAGANFNSSLYLQFGSGFSPVTSVNGAKTQITFSVPAQTVTECAAAGTCHVTTGTAVTAGSYSVRVVSVDSGGATTKSDAKTFTVAQ